MSFLSQACVDHGQVAQTGTCCESLVPWAYDANSGSAYDGFACWNAPCAQAGQWAGPGGINSGKCCDGLAVVDGKCSGGVIPSPNQPPSPSNDDINCPSTFITDGIVFGISDGTRRCNPPTGYQTNCHKTGQVMFSGKSFDKYDCSSQGGLIPGIPDEYLMYGGIALALLLMMGGKK